MAKIATAHIEIKPVLNDASLDEICKVIEERVAAAVQAGVERGSKPAVRQGPDFTVTMHNPLTEKQQANLNSALRRTALDVRGGAL